MSKKHPYKVSELDPVDTMISSIVENQQNYGHLSVKQCSNATQKHMINKIIKI